MTDLRATLQRLVEAIDRAESTRGVFSTADYHDYRCPKARATSAEEWPGEWRCACGREELEAAIEAASNVLEGE
jgi:hypothetical protein